MGKLFDEATGQPFLFQAWRTIRENGYSSSHEETRSAVKQFDRQVNRNIIRLQRALRKDIFEFDRQIGVPKKKSSGNGKRGIVMASVQNRIVERALLDVLQLRSSFVRSAIEMPTSVGGVPERSVPHGLKLICDAITSGFSYFVRSDISGFFDNVPRKAVLQQIEADIDDAKLSALLNRATTVTLANEHALGEDRKIFPTDEQGVAQGSPLSPLFGNLLLYQFDLDFNRDGIICVRFIDDFVLLSKDQWRVTKAFNSAKAHLAALGLRCHDPLENADHSKAQLGQVASGFDFLGYHIEPGLLQPSAKARGNLLSSIRNRIRDGKRQIRIARTAPMRITHNDMCRRLSALIALYADGVTHLRTGTPHRQPLISTKR